MKIKKTISDKVIAANRENSKDSTGPKNTDDVGQNARTHGLLSKRLVFRNEEEQQEFAELLAELTDEHRPVHRTAWEMVHELAFCIWKKAEANGWELQELAHRSEAPAAILKALAENSDAGQLPLFTQPNGSQSAAQLGWDCQELLVRTGTSKSQQEEERSLGDRKGKSGHVLIEAKLNTSLDTIQRYQSAIKRDLRDTIATLRFLQPNPKNSGKSVVRKGSEEKQSSRTAHERKNKS
ncbi:MAG: hypothetical protein WBX03_07450 [Terriglobales bacterium]